MEQIDPSDKTQILGVLAKLILPIVLLYLGHVYKVSEEKAGLHEKYVEMSLRILEEDPDSHSPALRDWALDILHHYSPVEVSADVRDHLGTTRMVRSDDPSN